MLSALRFNNWNFGGNGDSKFGGSHRKLYIQGGFQANREFEALALPGREAVLSSFDTVQAGNDEGKKVGAVDTGDGFKTGVGSVVGEDYPRI